MLPYVHRCALFESVLTQQAAMEFISTHPILQDTKLVVRGAGAGELAGAETPGLWSITWRRSVS